MKSALLLLILVCGVIGFVVYQLQKKPLGPADECREKGQILFAGDSLIRGTIGFDFVSELRRRTEGNRKAILNAGVNGDRIESLLKRLPELLACDPSKILLMIGTNDVILSDDIDTFRKSYIETIMFLQSHSHAEIAVTSIPLLAGDLESVLNKKIARYSRIIEGIAQQYSVLYIPVYERLAKWKTLQSRPDDMTLTLPLPFVRRPFLAGLRRFIFQQSLDQISQSMGSQLTIDGIHLNPSSGKMVADVIAPWVKAP